MIDEIQFNLHSIDDQFEYMNLKSQIIKSININIFEEKIL